MELHSASFSALVDPHFLSAMFRRVLLPGLLLASLASAIAAPPAWWASRGATDANPPNDDAAVNQGQLKQFTQKAVLELNARIPGGAGSELNDLVNGWIQAYQTGGYNAANPLPADFDAMNSGQLKWIANKVHARLVFAKFEDAPPVWLVPNPASDQQLVNLGQLKTVFNFDLTAPTGQLPLWWQKFHFNGLTGIDPDDDDDWDDLTNVEEYLNQLDPLNWDTDEDGLPDGWEIANNLNALDNGSINPDNGPDGDPDGDGVDNIYEFWDGGNPRLSDTDGDGLSDSDELYVYLTSLGNADTDSDGLTDRDEVVIYLTNPLLSDTDEDGMKDGWEITYQFDPLSPADGIFDTDGDFLSNASEALLKLNPRSSDTDQDSTPDGDEDNDGDLLTNFSEIASHLTNPTRFDTDGDFMPDGWEVQNNGKTVIRSIPNQTAAEPTEGETTSEPATVQLDPNDPSDAPLDPDQDGLPNEEEYLNGTEPDNDDTDGDGTSDGDEVYSGADPNDGSDGGVPGGPGSGTVVIEIPFAIGGDYAWWEMTIEGQGPVDTRKQKIHSSKAAENGLGDYEGVTQMVKLYAGNKYRVTMKRMGGVQGDDGTQWFCWSANVGIDPGSDELLPLETTFEYVRDFEPGERLEDVAIAYAVTRENGDGKTATWIIDNRKGLFTQHIDDLGVDVVQSLEAFLLPVDLQIFSGQAATDPISEEKEETEGAFTVANLNDTDSDEVIDNVDNEVKKAANAEAGVEDEVDLMKLVVTGPNTGRMKVTVISGNVEFWEKSTKETKKAKEGNAIFIEGTDLPKTLWVEATDHSSAVRDIELRLGWESPDQSLTDDLDTVKATAIWAMNTEVRNATTQTLWDEVDDVNMLANWNHGYGGDHFGIHYEDAPVGIGYSIGFQFTVFPTDIGDESSIKFDVTRQAEAKIWRLYPFPPPDIDPPPEPVPVEEPQEIFFPDGDMANDNVDQPVADRDNDNTPTNDHIHSMDSPGRGTREADAEEYIFRANFCEFVRVKVDGQQPTGNVLFGSRCSPKKNWHLRIHAINDNGTFKQNTNKPNDVDVEHIEIGEEP